MKNGSHQPQIFLFAALNYTSHYRDCILKPVFTIPRYNGVAFPSAIQFVFTLFVEVLSVIRSISVYIVLPW